MKAFPLNLGQPVIPVFLTDAAQSPFNFQSDQTPASVPLASQAPSMVKTNGSGSSEVPQFWIEA
jgi:hypothetical protein